MQPSQQDTTNRGVSYREGPERTEYGQPVVVSERVVSRTGEDIRDGYEVKVREEKPVLITTEKKGSPIEIVIERPVYHEKIIEFPVEFVTEVPKQNIVYQDVIIEKIIEKPVNKIKEVKVDKVIEHPVEILIEKQVITETFKENEHRSRTFNEVEHIRVVKIPRTVLVDIEVLRKVIQPIETQFKQVPIYKKKQVFQNREVEVQVPIYKDKIVEVPFDVEVEQIVEKKVPRTVSVDKFVDKKVEKPFDRVMEVSVDKVVDVPYEVLVTEDGQRLETGRKLGPDEVKRIEQDNLTRRNQRYSLPARQPDANNYFSNQTQPSNPQPNPSFTNQNRPAASGVNTSLIMNRLSLQGSETGGSIPQANNINDQTQPQNQLVSLPSIYPGSQTNENFHQQIPTNHYTSDQNQISHQIYSGSIANRRPIYDSEIINHQETRLHQTQQGSQVPFANPRSNEYHPYDRTGPTLNQGGNNYQPDRPQNQINIKNTSSGETNLPSGIQQARNQESINNFNTSTQPANEGGHTNSSLVWNQMQFTQYPSNMSPQQSLVQPDLRKPIPLNQFSNAGQTSGLSLSRTLPSGTLLPPGWQTNTTQFENPALPLPPGFTQIPSYSGQAYGMSHQYPQGNSSPHQMQTTSYPQQSYQPAGASPANPTQWYSNPSSHLQANWPPSQQQTPSALPSQQPDRSEQPMPKIPINGFRLLDSNPPSNNMQPQNSKPFQERTEGANFNNRDSIILSREPIQPTQTNFGAGQRNPVNPVTIPSYVPVSLSSGGVYQPATTTWPQGGGRYQDGRATIEQASIEGTNDTGRGTMSPYRSGYQSKNYGQRDTAPGTLPDEQRESAETVNRNLFNQENRWSQQNFSDLPRGNTQPAQQGRTDSNKTSTYHAVLPSERDRSRDASISGPMLNRLNLASQLNTIPEESRGHSSFTQTQLSREPGRSNLQSTVPTYTPSAHYDYGTNDIIQTIAAPRTVPGISSVTGNTSITGYQPPASQQQYITPRTQINDSNPSVDIRSISKPKRASHQPPASTLNTQLPSTQSGQLDSSKPMKRTVISENILMPEGVTEDDSIVYYYVDKMVPKEVEDIVVKYIDVPTVRVVDVPVDVIKEKIINNDKVTEKKVEVIRYVEGPAIEKREDVEIEIIKVIEKPIYVDKRVVKEKEIVVEKHIEVPTEKFIETIIEKYVDVDVDVSVIKKIPKFKETDLQLTTTRRRRTSHVNENLRKSLHSSVERVNQVQRENADLKSKLNLMREKASSGKNDKQENTVLTANNKDQYDQLKHQFQELKNKLTRLSSSSPQQLRGRRQDQSGNY